MSMVKVIVLACAIASAPMLAHAQPKETPAAGAKDGALERAKRAFKRGERLFAIGRFQEALAAYEEAYEAKPLPEFLFNIGQCHRNLGSYSEAVFSFQSYLNKKPDAPNRAAVETLISELTAKREEQLEQEREAERERRRRELTAQNNQQGTPTATPSKPIYKRWWFWAGAVGLAAAGTGTVLFLQSGDGIPDSDLGNVDFAK